MNIFRRGSLIALCSVLLSAHAVLAQDTPAATPQTQAARPNQPRGPRPNPTNIKALPKDITGDQLIALMRQYTADLGVECTFCHARNEETKRTDFASDANPNKDKARVMIKMTADINTKYLAELGSRMSTDPATCGTCHRGSAMPEAFVPKPRGDAHPPAAATPTTPQD
jgi:hypothetical protein